MRFDLVDSGVADIIEHLQRGLSFIRHRWDDCEIKGRRLRIQFIPQTVWLDHLEGLTIRLPKQFKLRVTQFLFVLDLQWVQLIFD